MRHWDLVPLFVSLTLLVPSPAAARAGDAKADLGANAAMKYWQAFALLPTLDKDEQKLLQEWKRAPLDASALKLIGRSRNSLEYLHRGAKLEHCDWSLNYKDGIRLLLPHATKSRTLARLAALHARHEFEQGHWKAGWEDVTAVLKLARHVEKDGIMIIQMVGYAIEATAIDAALPYLPELKSDLPESASAVLDALAAGPTFPQMLLVEKQVGPVWLIQELKKAEQHKKGSWQLVWKESLSAPGEEELVDLDLVKSAKTFDQAVKRVEGILPLYAQAAKMTALPWQELDAQYPQLVKNAKAANPLAGYLSQAPLNINVYFRS